MLPGFIVISKDGSNPGGYFLIKNHYEHQKK
jgi:hypothetical protein